LSAFGVELARGTSFFLQATNVTTKIDKVIAILQSLFTLVTITFGGLERLGDRERRFYVGEWLA
jgi:hypothetical protein